MMSLNTISNEKNNYPIIDFVKFIFVKTLLNNDWYNLIPLICVRKIYTPHIPNYKLLWKKYCPKSLYNINKTFFLILYT
jgi:hypothetical protein